MPETVQDTIRALEERLTLLELNRLNYPLDPVSQSVLKREVQGTLDNILVLKGGQTKYNTGIGFFLGNESDAYKLSIGNPAGNYLTWDGTTLTLAGGLSATSGTIGGFSIGADYLRDAANSFGLASTVSGGDDVRFWAGAAFADRATAPLRLTESGEVAASKLTITGTSTIDGKAIVGFSTVVDDGATPANPAGLTATAGIQAVFLKWTYNSETDIDHYDVYRHTADVQGSATKIASVKVNMMFDSGLTSTTPYYYWLKAVDRKGNISGFNASPGTTATPRDVGTTDVQDGAITGGGRLIDSYSEANQDTQYNMYGASIIGTGQTFNASAGDVYQVKWYLKKSGSPTGNAVAKLYAHTGTFGSTGVPTGAALATSENLDVSTLTTSFALVPLTFTTGYTLVAGTKYVITLEYSGGDASNYVAWGYDNSSPTHEGNGVGDAGSGWIAVNAEGCFYLYVVSKIARDTITADNVLANSITAAKMNVDQLSAITADLGNITAGTIVMPVTGYIRGGQTAFNTGTGFFLGYESAAYKFSIGNPAGDYLIWDGTNISTNKFTLTGIGSFGGNGSDGALAISSGTTTVDLGGASVVTKNYTSISITGTGALAFSNPHADGTKIILKSQGAVTLTSSTIPNIDASGMGASVVTNGFAILDQTADHQGVVGGTGNAAVSDAGGATKTGPAAGAILTLLQFYMKVSNRLPILTRYVACGSGGAAGGTGGANNNASAAGGAGGAGGRGGGALIIECGGAWNFTSALGISVAGKDGANGTVGTAHTGEGTRGGGGGGGGGSGGAGGMVLAFYNSLTANSGTVNTKGGAGGTGGAGGLGKNAGADGSGIGAGGGGAGGSSPGAYNSAGQAGGNGGEGGGSSGAGVDGVAGTQGTNDAGSAGGGGGGGGRGGTTSLGVGAGGAGGATPTTSDNVLVAQNLYFA